MAKRFKLEHEFNANGTLVRLYDDGDVYEIRVVIVEAQRFQVIAKAVELCLKDYAAKQLRELSGGAKISGD